MVQILIRQLLDHGVASLRGLLTAAAQEPRHQRDQLAALCLQTSPAGQHLDAVEVIRQGREER